MNGTPVLPATLADDLSTLRDSGEEAIRVKLRPARLSYAGIKWSMECESCSQARCNLLSSTL